MSDVVLVDATTLIALGSVGRVDLLENFDGQIWVHDTVRSEVTTEPAATNVSAALGSEAGSHNFSIPADLRDEALELLGDEETSGDVAIVAGVLKSQSAGLDTAVVSDDMRVRTVTEGLGATVTGTVGVVARAVYEGMDSERAKTLIRDIDSHGLHMTGELREKAFELIDDAADE